ncbi:MAG: hypothetical protein AB7S97_02405 [Thermoplasmata archaeon]
MATERFETMTTMGPSHALFLKDVQTKAMIADVESASTSSLRVRDIETALSTYRFSASARREIATVLMLASAFATGFLLFMLLL